MTASIHLLGRPQVRVDGRPTSSPRGTKAWALLAQLVLSDRPPDRRQLVHSLFPQAADPLGTLRWNLSELRRTLRGVATLTGDPLVLSPVARCVVDVSVLLSGSSSEALALEGFGCELLEGVAVPDAPAFEAWLAAQRYRVATCAGTVVVERTLDLLASGDTCQAVEMAARAVRLDPLSADHQAVLVRSLVAAGDHRGARAHAVRCTELFRRELGCAPPPEVVRAAARPVPDGTAAASSARVRALLDVGAASLTVGATDRAVEQLGRAAAMAEGLGEPVLRATAFLALAGARVHGSGERGTAVRSLLQEAVTSARRARAVDLAAAACRELGFLALQRGHQDRAIVWLDEGERLVADDGERARLLAVRGMCLTDAADHGAAHTALVESARLSRLVGDVRQQAWTAAMLGRLHVVRGEHASARTALDTALALIEETGWLSLRPWPETFRAEIALAGGDRAAARGALDHAWELAVESEDHCWLATVAHGQALLALADDRPDVAGRWVDRGLAPDPWYLWPYARLLDVACSVAAVNRGSTRGAVLAARLAELAGGSRMTDLLVHAHLHRARAGSAQALAAARSLATGVDDPALQALVAATVAEVGARPS